MNRETRELAEHIRKKKELQIVSGEHGLLDPVEGKRPLVSYADKQAPKNPLPKSLRYLRQYAANVQLGAVTERWVDGYRDFLLHRDGLGESTAGKYFDALRMVLRRAVQDLIIPRNPADAVKGIPAPESVRVFLTTEELEKLAGVDKPIGWHTARHTFATLTLEAGADFSTVSRMLGHTKIQTMAVYAKTTDRTKRAAVEALPELSISAEGGKA